MKTRVCGRALIMNQDKQILLMKVDHPDVFDPDGYIKSPYWITPGGEVESNETIPQTVAREISEECGFDNVDIGPVVWYWEHVLVIRGIHYRLCDNFCIVQIGYGHDPMCRENDEEREMILEYRWWESAEIKKSLDVFAPTNLGQLLEDLLTSGPSDMQVVNIIPTD